MKAQALKLATVDVSHPLITSTIIIWLIFGIFWAAVYFWNRSPKGEVQRIEVVKQL